jgi:hypothetical protein
MCCCHRPDREEPGHRGIQPCDSKNRIDKGKSGCSVDRV